MKYMYFVSPDWGNYETYQSSLKFKSKAIKIGLAPILSPAMNGLNHLRKQCTNTLINKILEEMYTGFIIQV